MLSPGKYYLSVPTDPRGNRIYRRNLIKKCRNDLAFRAEVLEACKRDLFFYISSFVWQYNPKRVGNEVEPFIPWDFQIDVLRQTMRRLFVLGRGVVWEKSRELGATWMALALFDWACLLHGWKEFLLISHTEEAVSGKSKNSLFWKLDFMHRHLPDWMRRGAEKHKSGFVYPGTESSVTGASTTERAGVSGRASGVLLDEYALQKDAYSILSNTRDTGPQLVISTHYGVGTAFADLCRRPDQFKLVMHWSQHPEKKKGLYRCVDGRIEILDKDYQFPDDYKFVADGTPTGGPFPGLRSVWYDAECEERNALRAGPGQRDVAMHLDIDIQGSSSQWYHPLMIQRLKAKCWEPLWVGELHHERDSGRPTRLVESEVGNLRLWLNPTPDGKVPPGKYGVSCDISGGTGATPSCLTITRLATGEKVGEYMNAMIAPEQFGILAIAVCRMFNDGEGQEAILVWEQMGPGQKFAKTVIELGFRRLWYREDVFDMEKSISSTPGWNPTTAAKRLLHDDYLAALDSGRFSNPSERALDQCLGYRYSVAGEPEHPNEKQTNDPSAGRVNHGDLVVADALGWMLAAKWADTVPGKPKEVEVPIGSLAWRREETERRETSSLWT